jgi:multicomponent Na+:H+ antiporter subunit G
VSIAIDALLALAVVIAWLGTTAFIRLCTPFERLHVVTFLNVTVIGAVMVAAFVADGISSRALKCALIWAATLASGALVSHVTGRALHLREGERR